MIGYKYLPSSLEELDDAAAFYENASVGLGSELLEEVRRLIDKLRDNPALAPLIDNEFRSAVLSRFPFNIIYSIEPRYILVIAVAHQSRRPGYWRDRVTY